MNKLPYDDQQELDQDTLDLINGGTFEDDSIDQQDRDLRNPAAMKYFQNVSNELQPEPQIDLTGRVVGKASMNTMRDPFQRLNELVPPQQEQSAPEIEETVSPVNPQVSNYENILKQLQDKRKDNNMTVNMARAGNQIAQALASGYGAKIGDGSENLNAIERSNNQGVSDYHEQIKNQMDDPSSAISKYYRLQTLKSIKEQDPKADLSQFDTMSANQLKDIVSSKNKLINTQRPIQQTDYETLDGKPLVLDVNKGTYRNLLDGSDYTGEVRRKVTGTYKDADGNQFKTDSRGNVIQQIKSPLAKTPTMEQVNPETNVVEKKKDYSTPTQLKSVSPELYKEFKKEQDAFVKDIKENREVATSATTLSKKLKPGANNKIDSGLLGGIQTQAAKMAGQKGVLTDQDLVKFAGAGGVDAAISRMIDGSFFGQMSDADVKFFKRFAEKMQESNAEDIQNRSQIFVKNVHNEAKDYLPELKEEDVSKWLNVESSAPASQNKPSGKVDSKIEEYSKQHNLSYEQAKSILTKRGYKPNE